MDSREFFHQRRTELVKVRKQISGLPAFQPHLIAHRRTSTDPTSQHPRQVDALSRRRRQAASRRSDRWRRIFLYIVSCFLAIFGRCSGRQSISEFHRLQYSVVMEFQDRCHRGINDVQYHLKDSSSGTFNQTTFGWCRRRRRTYKRS